MYNVAQDAHNCYPVSIEQVVNDIENKFKLTSDKDKHKLDITSYENFLERYIKGEGKLWQRQKNN